MAPRRTLDDLRRDLEEFGFEVGEEDYLNAVGLKDDVDAAAVYERYEHLHSHDTLDVVRRACSLARADDLRRLRFLEADVLGSVVSNLFVEEEDELATEESKAVVIVDGETITYRSVGVVIENEDDRARRRRLVAAERGVKHGFMPRVEDLERRYRQAFTDLGYPDDATRWETMHGIALAPLDRDMGGVLDDTAAAYARALSERLERVESLSLKEAESHDVAHMMRAKAFDAAFPKDGVVPLLHRFLNGMGFDVTRMPNVRLDLEDRPNKDPRAFVLPARVPTDVRLVTRPVGGLDDYRALFHESGHLLHFALTRADLPYEYRYFGDSGVTESYAFLFEHLFENPLFLKEAAPALDGELLRDYMLYSGLEKVMSLRYYAKALHYDRWLATHDLEEAPEKYVKWMDETLLIPSDPIDYLDTDGFYGVWYLRAWLFEVLHRRWLEREFGERWWAEPKAGEHLRRLYVRGCEPTVEDLAADLGIGTLTTRPLVEDARRLIEAKGV